MVHDTWFKVYKGVVRNYDSGLGIYNLGLRVLSLGRRV
jgi:hypothetical protein